MMFSLYNLRLLRSAGTMCLINVIYKVSGHTNYGPSLAIRSIALQI